MIGILPVDGADEAAGVVGGDVVSGGGNGADTGAAVGVVGQDGISQHRLSAELTIETRASGCKVVTDGGVLQRYSAGVLDAAAVGPGRVAANCGIRQIQRAADLVIHAATVLVPVG